MSLQRTAVVVSVVFAIGCGRIGYALQASQDAGAPVRQAAVAEVASFSTFSAAYVPVPGGELRFDADQPTQWWLVLVSARIGSDRLTELGVGARYRIDDREAGIGETEATEANSLGPWQHFTLMPPNSGPHTVRVELRAANSGQALLEDLRVIAAPLPSSADVAYTEFDDERLAESGAEVRHTLRVDAGLGAEYFLFAAVNAKEAPAGGGMELTWEDPSGTPWPLERPYRNTRSIWQSMFAASVHRLPAGSHEFSLRGFSEGAFRYSRIAALPVSSLRSFVASPTSGLTCPSSSDDELSRVSSPASTHERLVFQGMQIGEDCESGECANPSTLNAHRLASFWQDGTPSPVFEHHHGNCGFRPSYGVFRVLRSGTSASFENRAGPSDSEYSMFVVASSIFVLGI